MNNFYKGGRGLAFFKHLFRLFKSRNNRSRTLFSFVPALLCVSMTLCFSIRSFSLMALKNKVVLFYGLLCFMLFNLSEARTQSRDNLGAAERQRPVLEGEVRSSLDNTPVQGVSIRVDGFLANTDDEGKFRIAVAEPEGSVNVRHIGFHPRSIDYDKKTTHLKIQLEPLENQIDDVEVVSTGYQRLPKERATGSFVQINSELLNNRVSS